MSASNEILNWLRLNASAPAVKVTTLPAPYFKFPPSPEPTALPPPPDHPSLAHPFTIRPDLYNALLSPNVPITVALVYASVVTFLNSVNANRKNKPWAISRTRLFKLFVIIHNVILAVYSAWTFVGMVNALRLSLPVWNKGSGVAETLDSLCKLHGPRGHGSAATYNATTSAWTITNRLFHLGADGLLPETTDVGRLWNEGLAFYGWLFYLSKFYEVIDTFIILAKGRKSSFLQTYHHAGAMLFMWAGIRYMSPPIWMFVLVNSAIHAIMYTFYLLSTVGIRVPKWFKQSLTTLQISQFVVGVVYAFAHLFVAYQIPVSVPYLYRLGSAASSVVANAPSDVSSAASSAISTASAGTGSWLKKVALRAAGHEGLAENVHNEQGRPFGIDALHIAKDLTAKEETRYRDELQWVHCIDTSGQVFAILLNCLYLLPLTWLFAQFFIASYRKRVDSRQSSTAGEKASAARLSLKDASKGIARRLSEVVEEMHRVSEDIGEDTVLVDGDEVKRELKEAAEQAKSTIKQGAEKIKKAAPNVDGEKIKKEVQRDLEKARKNMQDTAEKVKAAVTDKDNQEAVKAKVQSVKDSVAEAVEKAAENVKPVAGKAAENAKGASENAKQQDAGTPREETKTDQGKDEASPERKSPNQNGTGADEATGQASSKMKDGKRDKDSKASKEDSKAAKWKSEESKSGSNESTKESEENKQDKKAEDKIIDESQVVRDEDVDTGARADAGKTKEEATTDEKPSKVKEGTSFADAAKE